MGKTLSSHIIHSLGGEYCWIVGDSEPIRLLKSSRSLSVYILSQFSVREILLIIIMIVINFIYEGNTGQYFNWITGGPQTKTIKQKLSNQKYISLKKKNCKYTFEKGYKEWKLYYNYKISLQWISTNYNYNKNTTRMGQARGRLWNAGLASEILWHPVTHVQKLQISLLMRITDFCPLPLHWGKHFTP